MAQLRNGGRPRTNNWDGGNNVSRLNYNTSQPQFSGDIATLSHFTNCYAVLVQGKTIRRHLYLNLPAATRAVARAQAKGNRADLVLVKLVPVDGRNLHMEVTE